MTDSRLYGTFEQDTKKFIHQINDSLIKLENNGYSTELINDVFRCIHSIKSEAAYLDLDEITAAAHEMESTIEPLRNAGTSTGSEPEVDPAVLEFCFATIDRIGALLINDLDSESEDSLPDTAELEEITAESSSDDNTGESSRLPYGNFELMLFREARSRGERLFRLSFGISDDESMKYPRAYLALSNLEQRLNVIKISPPVEEIDSSIDGRLEIVLTTVKSEKAVVDELNIDQIIDVEICELSYEEELKNLPVEKDSIINSESAAERVISVEAEEIDAISDYVSEIKKRLTDLSSAFSNGGADDNFSYDLAGIETISSSIEQMMSNLKTVDFNTHFAGYKRTVRDLAAKLDKKAELVFEENKSRLPRDLADFIAEPILQIIRNAVVHGIEAPGERVGAGKDETGVIRISVSREENGYVISIADDGAGIDEQVISDGNQDGSTGILEIITKPGFTSLKQSEQFAGRGVGLDLVINRIKKRSGRLELDNTPGAGCRFSIVLAENQAKANYLVINSAGTAVAVDVAEGAEVIELQISDIINTGDGCFYRNIQLFDIDGRIKTVPDMDSSVKQAVKISHLGKTGYLIFDEPLFEISHDKASCSAGISIGKYTRKFLVKDAETDYLLLDSGLLFD